MHDELDQLDQLGRLTAQDERALQIENLRYSLSCHIPAMKRRVRIYTGYGLLEFYGPQARKITALCEELLRKQMQRLERKGRSRRPASSPFAHPVTRAPFGNGGQSALSLKPMPWKVDSDPCFQERKGRPRR